MGQPFHNGIEQIVEAGSRAGTVRHAARLRVDEVPFVDRDDRYGTGASLKSVFDGHVLDQAMTIQTPNCLSSLKIRGAT
jgi:hypothetical protein